jgi:hypothetical protein
VDVLLCGGERKIMISQISTYIGMANELGFLLKFFFGIGIFILVVSAIES